MTDLATTLAIAGLLTAVILALLWLAPDAPASEPLPAWEDIPVRCVIDCMEVPA